MCFHAQQWGGSASPAAPTLHVPGAGTGLAVDTCGGGAAYAGCSFALDNSAAFMLVLHCLTVRQRTHLQAPKRLGLSLFFEWHSLVSQLSEFVCSSGSDLVKEKEKSKVHF